MNKFPSLAGRTLQGCPCPLTGEYQVVEAWTALQYQPQPGPSPKAISRSPNTPDRRRGQPLPALGQQQTPNCVNQRAVQRPGGKREWPLGLGAAGGTGSEKAFVSQRYCEAQRPDRTARVAKKMLLRTQNAQAWNRIASNQTTRES